MIERRRRVVAVFLLALIPVLGAVYESRQPVPAPEVTTNATNQSELASEAMKRLEIKGRAPKTGYARDKFGNGWAESSGCDTRNIILKRDLKDTIINQTNNCHVEKGVLDDPYSGQTIPFMRGSQTSQAVQIDHVVALSDAWQKGAQYFDESTRINIANDPLNLLAVDGSLNQKKGDGDAATWLPPNKIYRCRYVARQIAVKVKYYLWITKAESDAMHRTLSDCPGQLLPKEK